MEKLFEQLIEAAKKNKKGLLRLKTAIVTLQQYELAGKVREIEREAFPETDEVKEARKMGKEINLALRMVELNVSDDMCWLIAETLKMHSEKKGEFSIDDAVTLRFKKDELFDIE